MKIIMLVENVVYAGGLSAEHGLSLFIEHGGHRFLFDTGQGDRFLKNAQALGVDIEKVEALIVSHGHYDHAGGLKAFCRANTSAKIFIKEGFFESKYNKDKKFIGIPYDKELFEDRLQRVSHPKEIFPGVHLMTGIPLANVWDTHFDNLFVMRNGGLEPDRFADEQFLVIKEEDAISVISGCSHRGITNIVRAAAEAFADRPARHSAGPLAQGDSPGQGPKFRLVLGGFHLNNADGELADRVIHTLDEFHIERLGCCHCTGIENYARIKSVFGQRAFYSWTGTELAF
ncbi:MAG: MBL fold metallo-hydrolase [Rectinema sp.]